MTWETLKATYDGLTELMDVYKVESQPFSVLIKARRMVEVEMRQEGFEKEWKALAGYSDDEEEG